MRQKDMERFAFLYLCGQRDKSLLAGEERMTFQDFDRLVYITDVLGLDQMNLELWNRFSPQFKEQFETLEGLLKEHCNSLGLGGYEDDIQIHNKWFADFCENAPSDASREFLVDIFDVFHEEE